MNGNTQTDQKSVHSTEDHKWRTDWNPLSVTPEASISILRKKNHLFIIPNNGQYNSTMHITGKTQLQL